MKNLNLLTKTIAPIVIVGILLGFISFEYLNSFVEQNTNHEIVQKTEGKKKYIQEYLKSEFKLLFYLFGTSSNDSYKSQLLVTKKDVLNQLKESLVNSKDIFYILDEKRVPIKISNLELNQTQLKDITNTSIKRVEISDKIYAIEKFVFKPWKWEVVYLVDVTNFKDILYKNAMAIFFILLFILFVIIASLIVIFKYNIKTPIDRLLKHFLEISKGDYQKLNVKFNTKEIDNLIGDVNYMTDMIKSREDETNKLLDITKQNEEYMKDILSSQNSIIIINDTKEIIDVNESFFNFFDEYSTIEEFQIDHDCVCDYFIKEDGYIYKFTDKNWVEYIMQNPDTVHKVKMHKNNKYYFYAIDAKTSEKYDRVIITMTDITALERANSLLSQYKKAVDASAIVSKTDKHGMITYVNDKFIDISGYTKDELIGINHRIVKSDNTPTEVFKDMWHTILSKHIWHGTIENSKKDGSSYYVTATIVPMLDENDNILEFIALRYDISEQVFAIEEAKKAEKTKSLFLANMSHEIRTPLNAIIGFTAILKRLDLKSKEANYINIIDKSAKNLLDIVNDILDMSKIESGNLVCEKVEFNPFKEFNSVVDLFLAKADEKHINLVSSIDAKILQKIIGDPLRIKQVLSNLISNAIKFSSENTEILVEIKLISQSKNSCKIYFSVKDSGIGISKEKQKTIFENFTQADDSTSREFGGTGLGLSISNKIVQTLGSSIKVQSVEGEGAKFYFELEYETKENENKNLEELNRLRVAIVESQKIDENDTLHLKTYLNTITNLKEYESFENIESLDNYDLLFIDEYNINEDVKQKFEQVSTNLVLLSKEGSTCDIKNSTVVNMPFNTSVIFDILVALIDKTYREKELSNSDYAQFKGSVLIAEDHDINQELISMLLELRGIKHHFASNGQEAVDLFKKDKFDLVFMDINMPVKNGKEATSEIIEYEKENNLTHTPIVALSANVIESDIAETMKIGFDDYLLKPIDEIKLDEVFTRYLNIQNDNETTLPTLKPYSIEDSSKRIKLPEAVFKKIVVNFANNVDTDLEELKKAIEDKEFNAIESAAHKIKGVSLNLRMDDVGNFATIIEQKAIKKEPVSIEYDFAILSKAIKVVQESL
jgi:PAS domain S-box-containing protein